MDKALVRCAHCQTVNRISLNKTNQENHCGSCGQNLILLDKTVIGTAENFKKEVMNWPGFVLVDYWSPTCVHCKHLEPVLNEIAREKKGALKIVTINTAYEGQLAMAAQLQGVPTLGLYQGGKKLDVLPGALPKHSLLDWLRAKGGI